MGVKSEDLMEIRFRFEDTDMPLFRTTLACQNDIALRPMPGEDGDQSSFASPDDVFKLMTRPSDLGVKLTFIQCVEDRCYFQTLALNERSVVTSASIKDVDGDGQADLLLGFEHGTSYYFRGVQ